jgi:hypothetical protein
MTSQRVRGVIDASSASGLSLKPLFCGQATVTGTPSEVVLYSRVSDPRLSGAVRALAAAFRSASR